MYFFKFLSVFLALSVFCLAETKSVEEESISKEISKTIKKENNLIEKKEEKLLATEEKEKNILEKKENIVAKQEKQEEKFSF
ncbi:MAG: hypothetical protein AMS24_03385 [Chlamydiae bacterium SM23_39]|nr:MAG: hypothetical protein AMS24_03385 [Chlamydiae bacterium SM23_39]